jgi:hypothetical protein
MKQGVLGVFQTKYYVNKRILIGLGTGRCGTTSLASLLNSARGCGVTHEEGSIRANLSWDFSRDGVEKVLKTMESRPQGVVGDVAFYYLPYVRYIAEARPDATFICLRRDREGTIESYMKKTEGRDHWRPGEGRPDPWDRMYPKFDAEDKRMAVGMYWDFYYRTVDELARSGTRIRTFDMQDLNEEAGAKSIMEFAGLDHESTRAGLKKNIGKSRG